MVRTSAYNLDLNTSVNISGPNSNLSGNNPSTVGGRYDPVVSKTVGVYDWPEAHTDFLQNKNWGEAIVFLIPVGVAPHQFLYQYTF